MAEIVDAPELPDARNDEVKESDMADAATLNKSWDHAEARHDIAEKIGDGLARDFPAQSKILGPELTGKAICLGYFGAPGDRKDTDYSLGDKYGGYWGVATKTADPGFDTVVWQGSEIVHTQHTNQPTDTLAIGTAHGLNQALDGPA